MRGAPLDPLRGGFAPGWIAGRTRYLGLVAEVIEKHPDGTAVVVVPAADAAALEIGASVDVQPAGAAADALPWPFGALADKYPPFEIEEIKAARREALLGESE
jgi:acetylornithine deacetylase/succinyl-diaminopimelate desuccinylase-like protein